MILLDEIVAAVYNLIVDKVPSDGSTLVKIHTRSLEQFGDISFPIPLSNWYCYIDKKSVCKLDHIFQYKLDESIENGLKQIKEKLRHIVKLQRIAVIKSSTHLFFDRSSLFFYGIDKVLCETDTYGKFCLFEDTVTIITNDSDIKDVKEVDLTTLRLYIVKSVANNLLKWTNPCHNSNRYPVAISVECVEAGDSVPTVVCGPIINENGIKNTNVASDVFSKRASDMRMIAQHRYRVQVKSKTEWEKYFLSLGIASVTVELLSNKPHKPVRLSLNNLSGAIKGPSFIFYNCARLAVLLKEFGQRVLNNLYPPLPDLNGVDFSLLNQPEEWELLYVYILQFPLVIRNCVRSIKKGVFNPQHLTIFLSSLSSVFSVYYRKVRILVEPREHLFETLHSRIYLLKAVQHVFHNALKLLNIEPVQEM